MIRTLIVDDEALARQRIHYLLQRHEDEVLVVGECKSGTEAIQTIQNVKPDLIFLDIQMKDMNGFDVLSKLSLQDRPFIIFVTAYNEYALQAFEYYALDYLLKPIDEERFSRSLMRVIQQIQNSAINPSMATLNKLVQVLKNEAPEQAIVQDDKLIIRQASKILFLEKDAIKYIEASGYYVEVFTEDKKYLLRESLGALLTRLEVNYFVRIHRSTIINSKYLNEINSRGYGDVEVIMRDGRVFRVSKSYKEAFFKRMGL